jgi:hypothetical protein
VAMEQGHEMEIGGVLHHKVGVRAAVGGHHRRAHVHTAHVVEEEAIGHMAVENLDGRCLAKGSIESRRVPHLGVGYVN